MDPQEKLLQLKFHLLFAALTTLFVIYLVYYSPSFVAILSYFWPLVLSTAIFLTTVALFGGVSAQGISDSTGRRAGENLMGYVAGGHAAAADDDGRWDATVS
ncbi:hypothetical protein ACLOJK_000021 [Asimina triloba]